MILLAQKELETAEVTKANHEKKLKIFCCPKIKMTKKIP